MKYVCLLLFLLLYFAPGCLIAAEEKKKPVILESIYYQNDEHGETVNFKLNGIYLPKIFAIKGEKPRVVFDFIDTKYSDLINNIIATEGGLVKRVRVGIHNEPEPKTRVVVDLDAKGDFSYEHDFIVQENILTITIFDKKKDDAFTGKDREEKGTLPEDKIVTIKRDKEKRVVKNVSPPVVKMESGESVPVKGDQEDEIVPVPENPSPSDEAVGERTVVREAEEKRDTGKNPFLFQIDFEHTDSKGEMVLFKLNDFYPPIVFGIEKGNPRVVCDFLDTGLSDTVKKELQLNGKYVSRIRVAKHKNPDKIRVVLDLVPNRNYDLQQVFFKEENLFMIVVNSFDEEFPESAATEPE